MSEKKKNNVKGQKNVTSKAKPTDPTPVKRKRGNPNGKKSNATRIAELRMVLKPAEIKRAEQLAQTELPSVIELAYLLWRETVKPSDGLSAMQRRALDCATQALGAKAAEKMRAEFLAENNKSNQETK